MRTKIIGCRFWYNAIDKNLRQIFLSLKNQFVMKYFVGNYFESVLKTKFYLMRRELLFFFLFSVIFCVVFKAALKMPNATRFLLKIVLQLQRYMFQNCIVLKVCTLCFKKIERNIFLYRQILLSISFPRNVEQKF